MITLQMLRRAYSKFFDDQGSFSNFFRSFQLFRDSWESRLRLHEEMETWTQAEEIASKTRRDSHCRRNPLSLHLVIHPHLQRQIRG